MSLCINELQLEISEFLILSQKGYLSVVVNYLLTCAHSSLLCRFPKGVPWRKYSGGIDGLKLHIVVPGKDKSLGVY